MFLPRFFIDAKPLRLKIIFMSLRTVFWVGKRIFACAFLCLLCQGCSETSAGNSGAPALPNPVPLRAPVASGERMAPVLKHETSASKDMEKFDVPYFQAGNKSLYLCRGGGRLGDASDAPLRMRTAANTPKLFINDKLVLSISFWGGNKHGGGYPFKLPDGEKDSMSFDEKKGVYEYSKPYTDSSGNRAVFKMTLKAMPDKTVELSWDSGSKDAVCLWLSMKDWRRMGKRVLFGGREFANSPADFAQGSVDAKVGASVEFDGGAPVNSFRILFDDESGTANLRESLERKHGRDEYSLFYRLAKNPKSVTPQKGRLRIDFGECAVLKDAPPPTGSIDFWECDATHVPASPVRNIFPNPSFEQGTRYWRERGGNLYKGDVKTMRVVDGGLFGKKAALFAGTSQYSFPFSLVPGAKYVLSFYAKAVGDPKKAKLRVTVQNAGKGGNYPGKYGYGDFQNKDSRFKPTAEWQRFKRIIDGDAAGEQFIIQAKNVLMDGIQLEMSESGEPTEFVAPPIEMNFLTAGAPLNDVSFGSPIDARMELFGSPGARGKVELSIKNIYYETLFKKSFDIEIGPDGTLCVPVDIDARKLGCGIFSVRADFSVPGFEKYTDYYRFSVMKKLSNTHPTKSVFGTLISFRHNSEGDLFGRKLMEWGFGSTTWYSPISSPDIEKNLAETAEARELFKKYRISNQVNAMRPVTEEMKKFGSLRKVMREAGKNFKATPEMEKMIEECAYVFVKNMPPEVLECVALGNEEESSTVGLYDEYAKLQMAFRRGAKRANPNILVAPTHGTSGYSSTRGRDAIDGYLEAAKKMGVLYDAVAVHPYWNYDYDPLWDFDDNIGYLKSRMAHYGYPPDTPIYMSECGNMCDAEIPQWGTYWYDGYKAGKPSYDFCNQEIFQACLYMRNYLAALKYYPALRGVNVWTTQPYIDRNFSPLLLCKAVNTLGNLYPDVEYIGDIRPSAKIRGYAFKLKGGGGGGIAAVWSTDLSVVRGRRAGPKIRVNFGQPVEFFDFDGNPRSARRDADGFVEIPVTFAPLTIRAADPEKLLKALQSADVNDDSSSLLVVFRPTPGGQIEASLDNLTGRRNAGEIKVGGKSYNFDIAPKGRAVFSVGDTEGGGQTGRLYSWRANWDISGDSQKARAAGSWDMQYFYVPRVAGKPDWSKIPPLPMSTKMAPKGGKAAVNSENAKATYKLAWDEDNLYLRVDIADSQFIPTPEKWSSHSASNALYSFDCAINVYFDTAADARAKRDSSALKSAGFSDVGQYDTNDYVYHFAPTKDGGDGRGHVNRWQGVDQQIADGVNMATKKEAAEKIKCDWRRTPDGGVYEITFARRYIEPILLQSGSIAGFGISLHDFSRDEKGKWIYNALSNSTEPGTHTDYRPFFWPLMILK